VKQASLLLVSICSAALSGCSFNISGVFRNDTSNIVHIWILSPNEATHEELTVTPHSLVKRDLVGNAPLVLTSAKGSRLAHLAARPPNVVREYFDSRNSAFYYRITGDKIVLLKPAEGRTWK